MAGWAGRGRRAPRRRALMALSGGLLLGTAVTGVAVAPEARAAGATERPGEASELAMVRFRPGTPVAEVEASVAAAGGSLIESPLAAVGVAMVKPERGDFARRLAEDDDVAATWRPTLVGYHHPEGPKGDGGPRSPGKPKPGHDEPPPGQPPSPPDTPKGGTGRPDPGRNWAPPPTEPGPDPAEPVPDPTEPEPDPGDPTDPSPPAPDTGPAFTPDPRHHEGAFAGETNPRGILQWDDVANGAVGAWAVTRGAGVRVAVVDTGVDASHRELVGRVEATYNMLPCDELEEAFGEEFDRQRDCEMADGDGHGTWVASRVAGAANQFASNGIAPDVTILGYKALSTSLGGGATAWVASAMVHACTVGQVDLVNLSLGGYSDPADPDARQDYLLWVDVVAFCRSRGVAVLASAGNSHVRVDRVALTVDGRTLHDVGRVAADGEGYGFERSSDVGEPQPGFLEVPAGVPGVLMVSATNNATAAPGDDVPAHLRPPAGVPGRFDQLAYYSNYGSRVDLAAPGGARKFNLPRNDGGPSNVLYGGWGVLGALVADGAVCQESGGPEDFACFQDEEQTFGWLQGSSMSSPSATGVAALVLAARPELRDRPAALAAHLAATARTDLDNATPPLDPADTSPSYAGEPCETGYCHLDWDAAPIGRAEAYGAGLIDATAAVSAATAA